MMYYEPPFAVGRLGKVVLKVIPPVSTGVGIFYSAPADAASSLPQVELLSWRVTAPEK